MLETSTSLDGILDRRVMLEQPTKGYRVAVDTVFLAAAVPAVPGDRILDIGCGVGGAMLSLACRVAGVAGLGIEIQAELVEICRRNIKRNNFATGLDVQQGDATQLPPDLRSGFDHVQMNPPYHEEAHHDTSTNKIKRAANTEKTGGLALWIGSAARALKPSGTLTIIHRADRHEEILSLLRKSFGDVEILSLLPRGDATPKRIILRARKDAFFSVRECRALVMHQGTGPYTDEAEKILRHCQALEFQSP